MGCHQFGFGIIALRRPEPSVGPPTHDVPLVLLEDAAIVSKRDPADLMDHPTQFGSFDPDLFSKLPADRILRRLTWLHPSARQIPIARIHRLTEVPIEE